MTEFVDCQRFNLRLLCQSSLQVRQAVQIGSIWLGEKGRPHQSARDIEAGRLFSAPVRSLTVKMNRKFCGPRPLGHVMEKSWICSREEDGLSPWIFSFENKLIIRDSDMLHGDCTSDDHDSRGFDCRAIEGVTQQFSVINLEGMIRTLKTYVIRTLFNESVWFYQIRVFFFSSIRFRS